MNSRFNKRDGRKEEQHGSAPALSAVEVERPLLRTRADQDRPPKRHARQHRLTQPLPLAAVLLILLALIGYWSVYNQTTKRTQVLIAAHALPAGRVLRAVRSHLERAGRQQAGTGDVPAGRQREPAGRTGAEDAGRGRGADPADRARERPRRQRLVHARSTEHARARRPARPRRPRDRARDLHRHERTSANRAVARNLEVLAVGSASGFAANTQTIPITVALPDPSLASALALANEAGKLDLLRESGARAGAPIPTASAPGSAP